MKNKGVENIRIIKGFYRALSNGDPMGAQSVLAPEVEWTEPFEGVLPFGGWHAGAGTVMKDVVEVIYDNIRDFHTKPKRFFAVGDMVVVLGHSTGFGRITDIKLDAPTVHIWTLADGKAVRFQAFHDVLDWQAALGLTSVQAGQLAA